MRGITTIIIFLWLLAALPVFSQQINYTARNVRLETVFAELEKQSGYSFFYKSALLRRLPKVSVHFNNLRIEQALDQCLKDMPLTYNIIGKTIAIISLKANPALEQDNAALFKGRLTDEQNNALAGGSVLLKNTPFATTTDNNGEFALQLREQKDKIIQFSYVGFISQELDYTNDQGPVHIKLKENAGNLDQVQVIGYGQSSKRYNTGNVTTVKAAAIARQPVTNVLAALQGRVAGMDIVQGTGLPGGNFTVRIRGQHSMLSNNDPLFIVDGVPYPAGALPLVNNVQGGGNPLNYLDIDAIESVDVLKDADATAIYGTRAANGVVLISTKKGKPGKTVFSLNMFTGVGDISTRPSFVNTTEYLALRREAKKNDNMPLLPGVDYDLNGTWDSSNYTNWGKYLRGNRATNVNVHANISGGTALTQYFIGGGIVHQVTVQPENGADQLGSLLFNVSHSLFHNRLNVTVSGNYSHDKCTVLPVDYTKELYTMSPVVPLLRSDGSLNNVVENPFIYRLLQYNNKTNNVTGNARVSYRFSKKFELLSSFGYHELSSREYEGASRAYYQAAGSIAKPAAIFADYNKHSWIVEPQLLYKSTMRKFAVNGILGSTLQGDNNKNHEYRATDFTNEAFLHSINAAGKIDTNASNFSQYKYHAVFGRIKFAWNQKYLLSLNGRYDGSSRFGPDKQFNFFGSAGAAWIFSNEDVVRKSLPFVSFGKLRFSYGTTGNDGFENYAFQDAYTSFPIYYLNNPAVYRTKLYNPDLAWELTKKAEAGLELGFLHDRIVLSSSYYIHRSSGQLLENDISAVTGFSSIYGNSRAVVQNSGLEIELFATNIQTQQLVWSTSFNITVPRNRVTAFPGLENSRRYMDQFFTGQPLGTIKVYNYAGVNHDNGLYQFYDNKGNITQSPDPDKDKTVMIPIGKGFYGGLQNNISWRHFCLDVFFSFSRQEGPNQFTRFQLFPPGLLPYAMPKEVLTRWQKPGDVTNVQRMISNPALLYSGINAGNSSRAYTDIFSLYCRNVSLSYDCPDKWVQRVHLKTLKFYMQAQNLFALPADGSLDPLYIGGTRLMPPVRMITTGLTMTL